MTGMPIHIKIKALNVAGSTISKSTLFTLSDVPAQPFPAPTVVRAQTTTNMITVDFANSNADDGGAPITSVQLWMDDGKQGPFSLIFQTISTTTLYTIRSGIEQGLQYQFKFRVGNVNGFSEFSDVGYMFSFAAPDTPDAPTYESATDTTVTLKFYPSANDNGIRITHYELFIDQGNDLTSEFRQLASYSQFQELFTLDKTNDGLGGPATMYRVKIRAVNEQAMTSDFSNELIFALGGLQSAPENLRKNDVQSSGTEIGITWDKVTSETLEILGYKLYANTGRNDQLRLIYDGSRNPQKTTLDFSSLYNQGEVVDHRLVYKFQVTAVNYNGEGVRSPIVFLKSCTVPSAMPKPIVTVPGINR
jgi:hypothetical protein